MEKTKVRYATALKYNRGEQSAPQVVASGRGKIAENIISLARQNDIPVHEDPDLALALTDLEIGQEIPVELYGAVAEVLAFIMFLDMERSGYHVNPKT